MIHISTKRDPNTSNASVLGSCILGAIILCIMWMVGMNTLHKQQDRADQIHKLTMAAERCKELSSQISPKILQ